MRLSLFVTLLAPPLLLVQLGGCGAPTATAPAAQATPPSSTPPNEANPDATTSPWLVQFRNRVVDLEPFEQGFPYSGFQLEVEHGYLLYLHTTPEGQRLRHLPLPAGQPVDLTAGRQLTDIDWSTRSFWGGRYHPPSDRFLFRADERNDERINLWALDMQTGALEQWTDYDYLYGVDMTPDGMSLAWVARHGTAEPFRSCLYVQRWGQDAREVLCDGGGADRFTWTDIQFNADASEVVVRVQHDGNRNTTNLARIAVDGAEPRMEFLFERGVTHYSLGAVPRSWTSDALLYYSAASGFTNLYRLDIESRRSTALTDVQDEMTGLEMVEADDGTPLLLTVLGRPWESVLQLRDPSSGDVLFESTTPTNVAVADAFGDTLVVRESSVTTPFQMRQMTISATTAASGAPPSFAVSHTPVAGVPQQLASTLEQCVAERVTFPTLDRLADGSPRMLHAWLLSPREPVAASERLARIITFYGGGNGFSTGAQILCAAGIATLSPSPRGSSGFGAAFAALNDGDLGGDEIVDLFYAAQYLVDHHGYTPAQIGVSGGSHGGYAAMRALTFPPGTNGYDLPVFPFGFGLSHAGFSDILSFYETCNIPDWVILEAGDPATEADKLRDRSPLTHVGLLSAPLLLTHGENDSRVPVEESRRFAAAAQALGRPVTYVEFAGQGHGISGLENSLRYYRALFAFLSSEVVPRAAAPPVLVAPR